MKPTLARRAAAEFTGTGFLVAAVVGSGIMAERLANGNVALALLANTIATGAALVALILAFGPISGAHLNPVVTLAEMLEGARPWREFLPYVCAQVLGGVAGAAMANLMFGLPIFSFSRHVRSGAPLLLGEAVATFGLICVIWGCSRQRPNAVAFAVGAYITAAYWFTSSTSFANPAVALARMLSDTFAGIRPRDALAFLPAELAGGIAAVFLFRWLAPRSTTADLEPGSDEGRADEPSASVPVP
jgi:glycerol uptake facilitator-like aquaporin